MFWLLGLRRRPPRLTKKTPKAQCEKKGHLIRPSDYREWMFLAAGYGMNYSPGPGGHEMFTNVFVQHWAHDEIREVGQVAGAEHVCD